MAKTTSSQTVPSRSEIPENMRWDLKKLYSSDEAWERDFASLDGLLEKFQCFRGRLSESPQVLKDALDAADALGLIEERLAVYAHLKADEDTSVSVNSGRNDRISAKSTDIEGETAWFEPELMAIDEKTFSSFIASPVLAFYRRTLEETERMRKHVLSEKEERILGMSSDLFSNGEKAYSLLNDADLVFPKVKDENGKRKTLTHGNFITFMESGTRSVRKAAFEACYKTYYGMRNTICALLDGTVKANVLNAKLRNYPSALAAALDADNVPVAVFDDLVSSVNAVLPDLHRYYALRAKVMKLDRIEMYDVFNPIAPAATRKYAWDETVRLVKESLLPLGNDYCKNSERAFSERWVDVLENKGKRSGAYSSGCYGKPPYLLLNFAGTTDSVFTLAHELGHSMHSFLSDRTQKFHYASYRIFVAEIASTTNELLLHHHLMETAKSDGERAYLLNHLLDEIKGTVFRQTMFSEFERDIYAMSEKGEPLTPDALAEKYHVLNGKYFGESVVNTDLIRWEWARIPHFHYGFYVYKYATGMSAAAMLAKNILAGRNEKYLEFLSRGDSADVLDIMKDAGVDFLSPEPVNAVTELFRNTLSELEKLL